MIPLKCKRLIHTSDFKCVVNRYVRCCWWKMWSEETDNKLYESIPDLSERLPSVLGRKNETVLTSLHIGHSYLTHNFVLHAEDSPVCVAGDCRLTVKYILLDCADFREKCANFRGKYISMDSLYTLFRKIPPEKIIKLP